MDFIKEQYHQLVVQVKDLKEESSAVDNRLERLMRIGFATVWKVAAIRGKTPSLEDLERFMPPTTGEASKTDRLDYLERVLNMALKALDKVEETQKSTSSDIVGLAKEFKELKMGIPDSAPAVRGTNEQRGDRAAPRSRYHTTRRKEPRREIKRGQLARLAAFF